MRVNERNEQGRLAGACGAQLHKIMATTDWTLIGWFPIFVVYSYYRLKRHKHFIVKFREAGLLSGNEYEHFITMYTGWWGAYRWLPGSDEYPQLHEDREFRRFWIWSGYTTMALILLGGVLIYIFVSPGSPTHRMPVRPRFH